jgi:hypothetical protein
MRARVRAILDGVTEAELDRIEAQLAEAVWRARELGYLRDKASDRDPVGPSPVYAELQRLCA